MSVEDRRREQHQQQEELWREYARSRDGQLRERLILTHLPLVRYIASRMLPSLHASVEHQDLVSYGALGLMEAVERYNVETGTRFSTFATFRIQGAINDGMRAQAWEPRTVRQRHRRVLAAAAELERGLGRTPVEAELAEQAGMTLEALRKVQHDQRVSGVRSLNARLRTEAGTSDAAEIGDMVAAPHPGETAQHLGDLTSRMAEAMDRLAEQDRVLLEWVYVHGRPFRVIAADLGVTESWISHLHTRALVGIQRAMAGQSV